MAIKIILADSAGVCFGVENAVSTAEKELLKNKNLIMHHGDLSDVGSLNRIINQINPDEIYNLAAQSHVRISMDIPSFTVQSNALGLLNILEAYKNNCPNSKY